ncbi:hypothetical protein C8Q77DRAFT_1062570, partial [Trametes polyzona]
TFGRGTIRKFGSNVAALKKLAARDFEDMLQVSIPVFEGLLPAPFDGYVRHLLFRLATFHALAKLRLHSDTTLSIFQVSTRKLGEAMRVFVNKVCPEFDARELDKEVAARARKERNEGEAPVDDDERAKKMFNINTYKYHRLGDYPAEIRETGPLDGTSTQTVSIYRTI